MSDNYPSDVKLNENPNGTVSFATEVVATIAGLAATEVDGVASMVSPSSGLADMFTRKNNRSLTKGVRIDLEDNRVSVDITITVDYGSPVPDVARNIQENVKKAIETMSGLDVKKVDVHVTGISFEREQRANAELDEQHRKMLERNVEAEAAEQPAEEAGQAGPEEIVEVVEAHPDEIADETEDDDLEEEPEEELEEELPEADTEDDEEIIVVDDEPEAAPAEAEAAADEAFDEETEDEEDPVEDDDYEAGAEI